MNIYAIQARMKAIKHSRLIWIMLVFIVDLLIATSMVYAPDANVAFVLTLAMSLHAESQFRHFVRVQGDQLVENGQPFRFISWNIPNLHLVEDYLPFEPGGSGWRWPGNASRRCSTSPATRSSAIESTS